MRHGGAQLFPLVVLGTLALLSFLLQSVVNQDVPRNDGKLRHDPDARAENFVVSRFDADGQLKYLLRAPYMEHYPDDDSSFIRAPDLRTFRRDGPPVDVRSDTALVTARGEVAHLQGNVRLDRPATDNLAAMEARTPELTVEVEAGLAHTDSPVDIRQGRSWLKGTGMDLDNNASTMLLRSQVTGELTRHRNTP